MNRPWFIFCLLLALATGCAYRHGPSFDPRAEGDALALQEQNASATNPIDPAWLQMPTNEMTLGPGDRVDIDVFGHGDATSSALVGPDGCIYYSLLPGINVWGLTPSQARDRLQVELGKFVRNAKVSILVRSVQSRRVWVLGRLNTPGIYALDTPMTVLEAISRAGGLYTANFTGTTEELADLQHSFLLRRGRMLPVDFRRLIHEGDMSQNIYLEPDDFLYLPSALSTEVYILGAVMEPRAIAFKDQVTLSMAVATAGGFLPDAYPKEIIIVRGSLTQPRFGVVNFQDIERGKAREIALQPRDIIYVPDKPLELATATAQQVVETFVRTIAANQGAIAGGSQSKVGVNLNINQ
jgi:protein involved in polysaccharide export with SLBB domain